MKGYIHSLESFGSVDGPGVRFVVFFSGCPMRCQYCHNPDTWNMTNGTLMETAEILDKMTRNIEFYSTGGITATGGEALLQMDFLTELFEKAKKNGIHTCLDTSGILFNKENLVSFDKLLAVTDLVLLDIKHINDEAHKKLCGHSNKSILDFLSYLNHKEIPVWIRHVIVPGITDDEASLTALGTYLSQYHVIEKIEALPYHTMGEVKYEKLGIDYPLKGVSPLSKENAKRAYEIIMKAFQKA